MTTVRGLKSDLEEIITSMTLLTSNNKLHLIWTTFHHNIFIINHKDSDSLNGNMRIISSMNKITCSQIWAISQWAPVKVQQTPLSHTFTGD